MLDDALNMQKKTEREIPSTSRISWVFPQFSIISTTRSSPSPALLIFNVTSSVPVGCAGAGEEAAAAAAALCAGTGAAAAAGRLEALVWMNLPVAMTLLPDVHNDDFHDGKE